MEGRIEITYAAQPNGREGHGFLPVITVNGKPKGSTWASQGFDEAEALAQARARAEAEAARYVGDWHVTVEEAACR